MGCGRVDCDEFHAEQHDRAGGGSCFPNGVMKKKKKNTINRQTERERCGGGDGGGGAPCVHVIYCTSAAVVSLRC